MDCYSSNNTNSSYPIIYQRLLYSLLMPVILSVEIILIYFFLKKIKYFKLVTKISYLISGLVFLLFLLQPSMINTLIMIISCRIIGNKRYIMADISYECYGSLHLTYIFTMALPSILLWGFCFPLYFFYYLF
jgi:hypothetical protein